MSSDPVPSLSFAARRELIERATPFYREASLARKGLLLDQVVAMTGYARKYAIRLLNQTPDGKRRITRRRVPRYGSEVRQALLFACKATRHICAKRLLPFLPTLVAALERHGYLQLTQESRSSLLRLSLTTAERLLRSHRPSAPRGLCTTQAGPLLKHQIPIRTFHGWDDAQPGFLEADLVAHNGGDSEGCSLYTLTLTDVATGWTECLPVLYKSAEIVLAAFQQARALFPFPILGLDTDNGSEFINETLMRYCEAQQITFTRGRPQIKDDQCFVEQKNGAIVRQFVGFDRFVGQQAARQLRELYRALRLYVNCFQPSMKLLSKQHEGEKVRRIYDPAKTPLQRLLLSGILPAAPQDHLCVVAQALDPFSLLQQVEQLQQAFWRCAVTTFPFPPRTPSASIVPFCVERCLLGALPSEERAAAPASVLQRQQGQRQCETDVLDWPRTMRDPFEGVWELILSLVLAHPEWSGAELFQELQRLFPGRYHSSQLGTLQHGLRTIRARWLDIVEEPWPQEVIQACILPASEPYGNQQEMEPPPDLLSRSAASLLPPQTDASGEQDQPLGKEEIHLPEGPARPIVKEGQFQLSREESQHAQGCQIGGLTITIEEAVQAYLQEQTNAGRRHKTLEWHQTALGLLQHYLVEERHLGFLRQLTEREMRGWVAFLRTPSSVTGTPRRTSTIATYGRSVRAFCHWAVRKGYLECTPLARGILPKMGKKRIYLIEPDEFERLLLACRAGEERDVSGERAAARNRAILWVFLDTGMRVSELCGLRLSDVDRERRALRVKAAGCSERWMALSPNSWYQVLSYLERYRPGGNAEGESAQDDHLFLSEWYRPLTSNSLTLLFDRLWKRAGISDKPVSPSVLRDTFAVRFLQAGGELDALGSVLGLRDTAALKRYARVNTHQRENESQNGPTEEHASEALPAPHQRRRRRKKSSSAEAGTISSEQQGGPMTWWERSQLPMQEMTHERV